MSKFKIDKTTYSKSQFRTTYDVSKNKPLVYTWGRIEQKTERKKTETQKITTVLKLTVKALKM